MSFTALLVVLGLLALLLLIAAGRNLRRRRILGAITDGVFALVLVLIGVCALLIAVNLRGYQRLSAEQPVGEVSFTRIGYHQFNGAFAFPSGERSDFALRGDEWQVDARMLKWHVGANLVGFDAAYRLDRISGRYTSTDDERTLPRTVYPLTEPEQIDVWQLVQSHQAWIPWVDAVYGSATFLPMADGATYAITLSQSGLIARPLNQSARTAVGNWH